MDKSRKVFGVGALVLALAGCSPRATPVADNHVKGRVFSEFGNVAG